MHAELALQPAARLLTTSVCARSFYGQFHITDEFNNVNSLYVPSTGYEGARITRVMAIRLDGTKVPPCYNQQRYKKEIIERKSGVRILKTEKHGALKVLFTRVSKSENGWMLHYHVLLAV